MVGFSVLVSSLAVASIVVASPTKTVSKRAVIGHDEVVGFPETVPADALGAAYKAYQPLLKVAHGCVPFPAVDAKGDTGFVSSYEEEEL